MEQKRIVLQHQDVEAVTSNLEQTNMYKKDFKPTQRNNNRLRFALNNVPMSIRAIVATVVKNYTEMHPDEDDITVQDVFKRECKGSWIAHIIETEEEYYGRLEKQSSAGRTVKKVTLPNGQNVYVSNQIKAGHERDNFFKFMEVVHRNKWGTITRIKE